MPDIPDLFLRLAVVSLAATFAWAALAKLLRFASWRDALSRYGLARPVEVTARLGVPAVEAGVVALLVAGAVKPGGALAVALLAAFSWVLFSAARRHGERLPCGCFGRATTRDYRVMLLRNIALAVLAGIVLAGPERIDVLAGWRAPTASELLPALGVALGIALGALVVWQVEQASRRTRR